LFKKVTEVALHFVPLKQACALRNNTYVQSLDISTNLKNTPSHQFLAPKTVIYGETGHMAPLLKVIFDTLIWVEIVLNVRSLFQRPTFYNGVGKNIGMLKNYPPPLKALAPFSNLLYLSLTIILLFQI